MSFTASKSKKPEGGGWMGSSSVANNESRTIASDRGKNLNDTVALIDENTQIFGEIQNCTRIEIHGYVEGDLVTDMTVIHPGGKFYGKLETENADVNGSVQGDIFVKQLMNVGSTGAVNGNVQYGQLSVESGGHISAEFRNVPPELAGDLDLTVDKGKSVEITTTDLTAFDPDDDAEDLTYTVSNVTNGFIALSAKPKDPVKKFTQADLESGKVSFVHDGTETTKASFDVVVADNDGATSGAAQTVNVTVRN